MAARTGISVTQTQRLTLTGSLHNALRVLRMDAAGLGRYIEDQANDTPALAVAPAPPALGDWLPRWSGLGLELARGGGSGGEPAPASDHALRQGSGLGPELRPGLGDMQGRVEAMEDQGPSLMAHVVAALPRLVPQAPRRRIAMALAEALEPTGWLGRRPEEIAGDLGVAETEVEAVLGQLQRIEPAGLFARNLSDCLRLQAAEAEALDRPMRVLLDNLPRVAAGQWDELARLAEISPEGIRAAFARLRTFNPKPGTAFSSVASPLREPDLIVRRDAEGAWQVEWNRSSLPALRIDADCPGAGRARALVRLVESRNATLLTVARAVLSHQKAALDAGPKALRPLTMQSVADQLGMHKSTVSRVVAGTSVDTPLGCWWLRALFSSDMGADTAAAALKARLARIVGDEDKAAPLSDDALASALSVDGAVVARRTVAKYRAALHIGPAHRRRLRKTR